MYSRTDFTQAIENRSESVSRSLPLVAPFSISRITGILLLAISLSGYCDEHRKGKAMFIEVFTSAHFPIRGSDTSGVRQDALGTVTHYDLDGIDQLQQTLSLGLPNDPGQAKQLVLQRFQSMDAAFSHRLENSGNGLVLAMHYGIDRTPAIVFDRQAVIYGVTDVDDAIEQYSQWRERDGR
jgi:integrating conjugative element protein (TIGR03757 family)